MNKRSLLFIISVAACFVIIHYFFSFSKDNDNREKIVQNERAQAQKAREISKKTANIIDLPIHILYADDKYQEPILYALKIDHQFLTLADKRELRNTLYTDIPEIKALHLQIKPSSSNDPALYSPTDSLSIDLPYLPENSIADLQLVCFSSDDKDPKIFYGEYQDGYVTVPLGKDLKENAIALYLFNGQYFPVGVYEHKSKRLRLLQDFLKFRNIVHVDQPIRLPLAQKGDETFYVLQNEFQQLVFSTQGGALAEINLPFHTKENKQSVINPIDADRIIEERYPQNNYFPQGPYHIYTADGEQVHDQGELGGFYPLIRRSLYNQDGSIKTAVPARYYSMNVIGDDPDTETLIYHVSRFSENMIEFEASQPYRRIVKTYTISDKAPYCFDLSVRIEGDARNLWISTGVPEVEIITKSSNPALKYRMTRGNKSSVEKIKLPDPTTTVTSLHPDWVVNSNGFLGVILDPLSEIGSGYKAEKIAGEFVPTRLSLIDPHYKLYPVANYPGYELLLPLRATTQQFRIFAGPFEDTILKKVDHIYSDPETHYNPDYLAAQSFHGFFAFISEPFAKFLYILMTFFYKITHSWAFSIILLTVALRIMLYPLNAWSIKSSYRMQQFAPLQKKIQEKYKKDPKRVQIETMNLYRQHGINPFSGCFPVLIQLPFLIGMFDLLKSTFELRGASFIPGWINNLTAPDVLFSWNYPIFFLGTQFHLLPIIMGAAMFFQQKLTMKKPKGQTELTDQQKQQKTMGIIMPIVFIVIFYNFPSGLNIYFLSSTLLGILQQWYMTKTVLNKPIVLKKK